MACGRLADGLKFFLAVIIVLIYGFYLMRAFSIY